MTQTEIAVIFRTLSARGMPPNNALQQTLDPAVPFAAAEGPSASSAAELGRLVAEMTFADWVPPIFTTSALAVALWLSRKFIATRLLASVTHEFEVKLEKLRADIRGKEAEIAAIRKSATDTIEGRNRVVLQRRLQAVDEIWSAAIELRKLSPAASIMSAVRFDVAAEQAKSDPSVREGFKTMRGLTDVRQLNLVDAHRSRPHVTPLAWAYYVALQTIMTGEIVKLLVLQHGVDRELLDRETPKKLIKAALPEFEDYIDEYGDICYRYLIELLENRLISELQDSLYGQTSDHEDVVRAARIVKLAGEVSAETSSERDAEAT